MTNLDVDIACHTDAGKFRLKTVAYPDESKPVATLTVPGLDRAIPLRDLDLIQLRALINQFEESRLAASHAFIAQRDTFRL